MKLDVLKHSDEWQEFQKGEVGTLALLGRVRFLWYPGILITNKLKDNGISEIPIAIL